MVSLKPSIRAITANWPISLPLR